ncbi:MAG TPA: preprotein translocase subunit SecG [Planctomycetota bacterium]|jgi:protein translocase SecG subunit
MSSDLIRAILQWSGVIVGFLMVFFILLQEGKGGGLAGLGGTKAAGVEGVTNPIRRATVYLAVLFFLLLIVLGIVEKPAQRIGLTPASATATETEKSETPKAAESTAAKTEPAKTEPAKTDTKAATDTKTDTKAETKPAVDTKTEPAKAADTKATEPAKAEPKAEDKKATEEKK